MEYNVYFAEGPSESFRVTHIADEVAQAGMFFRRKELLHLMLFEFVPAERGEKVLRLDGSAVFRAVLESGNL